MTATEQTFRPGGGTRQTWHFQNGVRCGSLMNRRGYPGWGVVDLGSLEERHAVSGEHLWSPAEKILDWMRTHATSVRKNTQLLLVSPFTSSIFLRTFNIPHIQHQYKIHANIYYICTNEQKLQSINIDAYQDTALAKRYMWNRPKQNKKYMWNRPKQTTAKRKPHQQPDQPCTLTRMRGGKRQRRKSSVQLIPN